MNKTDRKVCDVDRGWAARRVDNIYKMLDKVKKDDSFLFECAADALRTLSHISCRSGDDAYSTFLAAMANRLGSLIITMTLNKTSALEKPRRSKTRPQKA